MRSINIRKVWSLPVAALLLSGSSLLGAPSAPATQLLEEVRSISHDLSREAATLESYASGGRYWQTHAYQLHLAKQHINAIGERLTDLQAIRGTAEPWQQQAIDSIVPVAEQLAARTQAAIVHLNESPRQLFAPSYKEHLSAIADHSDRMKQAVGVHLEMASTRDKLNGLQDKVTSMELGNPS
jgi:hypothetical protein